MSYYTDSIEPHLAAVTEARVLRQCVRDATTLSTFAAARDAAATLGGFDARMVACGQVSAAMRMVDGLQAKRRCGRITDAEQAAWTALDAWVGEFFASRLILPRGDADCGEREP